MKAAVLLRKTLTRSEALRALGMIRHKRHKPLIRGIKVRDDHKFFPTCVINDFLRVVDTWVSPLEEIFARRIGPHTCTLDPYPLMVILPRILRSRNGLKWYPFPEKWWLP